jgi:uncharacterized protein
VKVDFRQIKSEGTGFRFSESSGDLDVSIEGVEFPEPIEVDLSASRTGDELIFNGTITTVAELECSRCLDNFEFEIASRLQFVIQLMEISQPQDSDDDDFVVLPKTTQEYDIDQRIREAIILELPLKALCSDSCLGLCPMCGTNLNESECGCTPDKTDERWESLRQLFEE